MVSAGQAWPVAAPWSVWAIQGNRALACAQAMPPLLACFVDELVPMSLVFLLVCSGLKARLCSQAPRQPVGKRLYMGMALDGCLGQGHPLPVAVLRPYGQALRQGVHLCLR